MLKPLDGVIPYRLEMQAKAPVGGAKDLYHYWGRKLYDALEEEGGEILNLASKEYYKCIEKYKSKDTKMITCVFAEESKGKLVQKGTYAKMARGEMVRFMSEKKITRLEEIREFDRLEFKFSEEHSDDFTYTFLRNPVK